MEAMPEIRFTVHEQSGVAVFSTDRVVTREEVSTFTPDEIQDLIGASVDRPFAGEMQEGLLLLVPGLLGGYIFAIAERDGKGGWSWTSANGTTVGILEFDTTALHCWACVGMANLSALKRLDLSREP